MLNRPVNASGPDVLADVEANENQIITTEDKEFAVTIANLTDARILQIANNAGFTSLDAEDVAAIKDWFSAESDDHTEIEWVVREIAGMRHRFNTATRPTVDNKVPPLPVFADDDVEDWELDDHSGQLVRAWSREFGKTCWIELAETVDDDGTIIRGDAHIHITDRAMWTPAEALTLTADLLAAVNALDGQ